MLNKENSYSVLSSFISVRPVPYLSFKPCSRTRNFFTGIFLLPSSLQRVSQFSPNPQHPRFHRKGAEEEQSRQLWGLAAASGPRAQGQGTTTHSESSGKAAKEPSQPRNHACRSTAQQEGKIKKILL